MKIDKYYKEHGFAPSFTVIFTGRKAVVSIKHYGEEHNVGHVETYYGIFFWYRLARAIRKCFKEQIKHENRT